MFSLEFLKKYPQFTVSKGVPLTLLPPNLRSKPLDEIIRDDDELDGKLKVEKKKQPESVEAVVFARATVEPLVWFKCKVGDVTVPIVDVTPTDYPLLMDLIKEQFLTQEPLSRAMRIREDPVSVQELMHLTVFYLDSSTSLLAMDPVNHVPIGLMIGKVDDVDECTEKAHQKAVLKSKRVQTILSLTTFMVKTVSVHDRYNCKLYFRIFFIAVHKDWQLKGVEKALITGTLRMCNVMKIPKVAGNFTMYKDQYYFKQFGAKTELDVYYSEWRTNRGLRIFRGTGKTEPKISFMSLSVPDFEPSTKDVIMTPLTSQRARRFIKKRMRVWEEINVYKACQCGKKPEELNKSRKKRKMKVVKKKEADDSNETATLKTDSRRK